MGATRFKKFIRHYERHYRSRAEAERGWFQRQPTLRAAISYAALARSQEGRKLEHQWRLKNSDLSKAEDALLAVERKIARFASFDELHEVVSAAVRHIWRNPEPYCYDTALHIGARLGLKPDRIYLHRGTRVGARKLGLKTNGVTLDASVLPEEFRGLEASELEDILCIYKDQF